MKKKYTFVEFIAALETEDFDIIDKDWLIWANKFVDAYPEVFKKGIHDGDCTKQPFSCMLCLMDTLLLDYKEYYFNEKKWREDNYGTTKL